MNIHFRLSRRCAANLKAYTETSISLFHSSNSSIRPYWRIRCSDNWATYRQPVDHLQTLLNLLTAMLRYPNLAAAEAWLKPGVCESPLAQAKSNHPSLCACTRGLAMGGKHFVSRSEPRLFWISIVRSGGLATVLPNALHANFDWEITLYLSSWDYLPSAPKGFAPAPASTRSTLVMVAPSRTSRMRRIDDGGFTYSAIRLYIRSSAGRQKTRTISFASLSAGPRL